MKIAYLALMTAIALADRATGGTLVVNPILTSGSFGNGGACAQACLSWNAQTGTAGAFQVGVGPGTSQGSNWSTTPIPNGSQTPRLAGTLDLEFTAATRTLSYTINDGLSDYNVRIKLASAVSSSANPAIFGGLSGSGNSRTGSQQPGSLPVLGGAGSSGQAASFNTLQFSASTMYDAGTISISDLQFVQGQAGSQSLPDLSSLNSLEQFHLFSTSGLQTEDFRLSGHLEITLANGAVQAPPSFSVTLQQSDVLVVPLPSAGYAGLGTLTMIAGVRVIRRRGCGAE